MEQSSKANTIAISALVPVMVGVNLVIGQLVSFLKLPLYLDSIGIIVTAVLAGPMWGALVGTLTAIIGGLVINPTLPWYVGTGFLIGVTAGLLARWKWFTRAWKVVVSGIIIGLVAALASAPITAYLFGGITFSGVDVITAFLRATGQSLITAAFLSGIASDPVDKVIASIIAWTVLRGLPRRVLVRYPSSSARVGT